MESLGGLTRLFLTEGEQVVNMSRVSFGDWNVQEGSAETLKHLLLAASEIVKLHIRVNLAWGSGIETNEEAPRLVGIGVVVHDLAACHLGVTVEHLLGRRRLVGDVDVIDGVLADGSKLVEADPPPEDDNIGHVSLLQAFGRVHIEYLALVWLL